MPTAPSPHQDLPIKCLLVDDLEENLTALEALLQREGLTVLKAQSGAQALELLLVHGDIALALLDVQMPEMDGFELAELIRGSERTKHIPLVFMTAGSHERNWQFRGYDSGAVDFLYKPLDPHMLLSKVEVFFELQRRKLALQRELHERTEALRIIEMFMAVLGHDLRTPLQTVSTAASLLKRQPDTEMVSSLAQRILNSGQRMGAMIEDLLDVTRIRQGGGLPTQPAPADMGCLLRRALEEVQTSAPERTVESIVEGALSGCWDPGRMAQLLSNLVGNALHHGDPQQPVRIEVNGQHADWLSITVSNGGSIPAELMSSIFAPFRGRERGPGRHQGLGLGLFIADNIVRAHGGTIAVCSEEGRTRFSVTLPRSLDAQPRPSR